MSRRLTTNVKLCEYNKVQRLHFVSLCVLIVTISHLFFLTNLNPMAHDSVWKPFVKILISQDNIIISPMPSLDGFISFIKWHKPEIMRRPLVRWKYTVTSNGTARFIKCFDGHCCNDAMFETVFDSLLHAFCITVHFVLCFSIQILKSLIF